MQHYDYLLSLPTSLSCNVLRDWLNLKSVVVLDSAYCCKALRRRFNDLLQSDEYFVRQQMNLEQGNILTALFKFGKQLKFIKFTDKLSEATGCLAAQHCHHLAHLCFEGQPIPALWGILRTNSNIQSLTLRFCLRTRANPLLFNEIFMPNLRTLVLSGGTFEHESIVDALKISNNIVQLVMSGTKLNRATILQLSSLCPHLTSLGLAYSPLNDELLSQLITACPHIKHLDLEFVIVSATSNTGITDEGILTVTRNLKGLQSLNIKHNKHLSDISLVYIYTHCADTLHTLYLDCAWMNGQGNLYGATAVHELLQRCTKLRALHFDYWHDHVTFDASITLPACALQNLTTLVVKGSIVCGRNLTAICNYGTNLQILGVFNTRIFVRTEGIILAGLFEGCPNLRELYAPSNTVVTSGDVVINMSEINRPGLTVAHKLPENLTEFIACCGIDDTIYN